MWQIITTPIANGQKYPKPIEQKIILRFASMRKVPTRPHKQIDLITLFQ